MKNTKLGWIGLGNMGNPMAKNLLKAGHNLSVYNRSLDKTEDFKEQAVVCQSISELLKNSDIIFTMLTNDDAVNQVYQEISKEELGGKLFIDCSTISQECSLANAKLIKDKNAGFIDAPVAGSTIPAKEGTLIIMAGGDEKDIERAKPYFEKLGKLTKHLGANGSGVAAKLSINYFLSLIYQGLAETVLFSEQLGLNRKDMLEIINESACGNGATKVKTPLLINDNYPAAFALDLMLKDILLAQKAGADFPLSQAMIDTYQDAHNKGLGKNDVIGIIEALK
ncbi:NAD(P)-dependent oxidoreductase [Pedobacter xixiisoli]|uniref:3-hydroxyisobutyrate dehydrogenase n=1 Tax=Pedobacter xixiisoli TaxID=1476464 RepID=A0A285ZTP8_9SPHI|nr:NAD(P)-dependent oxidoreductase [Pedobacter xixiisoli]SOD13016.1 3-hydroxyisobutyrate dehydrogenase [Pedobacter xixiisoli]